MLLSYKKHSPWKTASSFTLQAASHRGNVETVLACGVKREARSLYFIPAFIPYKPH
jgi:hypothetical protein